MTEDSDQRDFPDGKHPYEAILKTQAVSLGLKLLRIPVVLLYYDLSKPAGISDFSIQYTNEKAGTYSLH